MTPDPAPQEGFLAIPSAGFCPFRPAVTTQYPDAEKSMIATDSAFVPSRVPTVQEQPGRPPERGFGEDPRSAAQGRGRLQRRVSPSERSPDPLRRPAPGRSEERFPHPEEASAFRDGRNCARAVPGRRLPDSGHGRSRCRHRPESRVFVSCRYAFAGVSQTISFLPVYSAGQAANNALAGRFISSGETGSAIEAGGNRSRMTARPNESYTGAPRHVQHDFSNPISPAGGRGSSRIVRYGLRRGAP